MMLFCSCGSYSVIVNFPGFSPFFTNQSWPILGQFGDHTKYPLQTFNDAITDAHSLFIICECGFSGHIRLV